jgi:phosphatidylserine/phosphatidylglycerophosphate/cardiolipin synthase-like enzyme
MKSLKDLFYFFHKSKPSKVAMVSDCCSNDTNSVECYFPRAGENVKAELISVIDSAKSTLDIAIYSMGDPDISNEILKVKQRGIPVRVITDRTEGAGKYQEAIMNSLKAAGIPVKKNNHAGLMHLKVSIVDSATVTSGSFNYTKTAENENDEVFIIIRNQKISQGFTDEFNKMWSDTKNYVDY